MNRPHNKDLLENVREYLCVGKINTYQRENREVVHYVVQSIPQQISVVIPLMDRNEFPMPAHRKEQYINWKQELLKYIEDSHGKNPVEKQ